MISIAFSVRSSVLSTIVFLASYLLNPDKSYIVLNSLYERAGKSAPKRQFDHATSLREGVLDLLWDPTKVSERSVHLLTMLLTRIDAVGILRLRYESQ